MRTPNAPPTPFSSSSNILTSLQLVLLLGPSSSIFTCTAAAAGGFVVGSTAGAPAANTLSAGHALALQLASCTGAGATAAAALLAAAAC
jgi:hypothetical protein